MKINDRWIILIISMMFIYRQKKFVKENIKYAEYSLGVLNEDDLFYNLILLKVLHSMTLFIEATLF
jgi:hypothetical protein